ncbi:hypothetical protein MRB53_041677 [Persea americana]|nr:hypothetical protein MRB53_041677 [Persea americana]
MSSTPWYETSGKIKIYHDKKKAWIEAYGFAIDNKRWIKFMSKQGEIFLSLNWKPRNHRHHSPIGRLLLQMLPKPFHTLYVRRARRQRQMKTSIYSDLDIPSATGMTIKYSSKRFATETMKVLQICFLR